MTPEEILRTINNLPSEQREQLLANLGRATQPVSLFEKYVAKECHTDEERDSLTADVNSFWERLNSYMTPQRQRAYGLAVGRVQSGKTRNYIGLMFKAIDEGYNTIIILTSKNSRLAVQTHKRVEEWFGDGEKGLGVPNGCFLTRIRTNTDGVENGVEWFGGSFQSNRIHVGIVLKNERGHLEQIKGWLARVGDSCGNMRILVIDDESDSATPNTRSVSDPVIDNDADVSRYANIVREQCPFLLEHGEEKGQKIAEWMEQLLRCKIPADAEERVCEKLTARATSKNGMMSLVCDDPEFRGDTGLGPDVTVQAGGQNWDLWKLVYDCFNKNVPKKRAKRNNSLNWSVLQALFFYVFGVKQERSRINRSICEIAGLNEAEGQVPCFNYGKMIYVGYTATPFANMLNEDPTRDPLCPDCIQPLTPSSKYFGLQRIFGGSGDACNMNIVRAIEEDEYKAWVEPIQSQDEDGPGIGDDYSDDLIRHYNFAEEGQPEDCRSVEWKSLKRAIQWAFCTAAARRVKRLDLSDDDGDKNEIKNRWTTMLFNLSHLSNQEDGVHKVQQQLVQRYVAYVMRPENREGFVTDCRRLWKDETSRFSREDFRRVCEGYGEVADYPTVDDVGGAIRDWFLEMGGKVKVIQVNSAVVNEPSMDYNNPNVAEGDVLWIICGGNAISRGLTLDGLTVSYYDRIKASSAVDTITQMGRWFGYRPGYELLPRIWMTPATIAEMKNICRIEESLHGNLLELYQGEDTTSIRKGRNIASVLFFGRRLSGRDANGMSVSATASKGIFNHVRDVNDRAMGLTRAFLDGCGDLFGVQPGSTQPLNMRHRLFWRNVAADRVCDYIAQLKDAYFADESIYEAEGLIREIKNSQSPWNVVVGNPTNTERSFGENEGMFAGLGVRNNDFRRGIGAGVRIGTGQWTSNAFIARMPDNLMDQALKNLTPAHGQNVHLGDIRHVEETFKLAAADDQLDRALVNPTLLIDFTHGDDDRPYVQVSFYWYGRSEESYFRAVVNPRPSSDLFQRAIGIVQERHYISSHALCRILGVSENDPLKDQLLGELQAESQNLTSAIGEVCAEEAQNGLIQKVFYSKEWAKDTPSPPNIGERVGYDLYKRILENMWYDSETHKVNFDQLNSALTENYLEFIIRYGAWFAFENKYASFHTDSKSLERYNDLVQGWQDCLGANNIEGMKKVINELTQMGNEGFPLAYYRLGMLCVQKNPDRAKGYFNAAAIQMERLVGHAGGVTELCLAEMNYYGRGLDQNTEEAIHWCQRAQSLGNREAATLLEEINSTGEN